MSDSLWPRGLQHARLPCHSASPGACSNSRPLGQSYCPTISSSVVPFSSCLQSFPASWSFLMSQLFASGGQSIGTSTLTSVLPMNIQDSSPLGWTGLISLQSKGLTRVFSNTTVQKHQFLGAQFSLHPTLTSMDFHGGSITKESACCAGDVGLNPGLGRFPWRRAWQITPVFLPGESPWTEEHGQLHSMGSRRVSHTWATKNSTRIHTWQLEKQSFDCTDLCWQSNVSAF